MLTLRQCLHLEVFEFVVLPRTCFKTHLQGKKLIKAIFTVIWKHICDIKKLIRLYYYINSSIPIETKRMNI